MCGICGAASFRNFLRADDAFRMVESLIHRGPDGSGLFVDGYGIVENTPGSEELLSPVLLGHTRLSILDLSGLASQPMPNADGSIWITYNGEIYNFKDLRERLTASGYRFKTQSDTEVVLKAYEEYGDKCVEHLRGMFAFAIWDTRKRKLFLARDRLGIKPLYFYHGGGVFAFASEVRALSELTCVPKDLALDSLLGFLKAGHVPSPETVLSSVQCIAPGSTLTFTENGLAEDTFWSFDFSASDPSTKFDIVASLQSMLYEAIDMHLVSDRPIGLFLSGGIDSTVILSAISRLREQGINTFSLVFPGCEEDESRTARIAASAYGSHHHEWPITNAEVGPLFSDFLDSIDQPSIDGFNTYLVSRFTKEHGVPVALSGLGGDELFAGYDGFRRIPKWIRLSKLASFVPDSWYKTIARSLLSANNTNLDKACEIVLAKPRAEEEYGVYRSVLSTARLQSLLNQEFLHEASQMAQERTAERERDRLPPADADIYQKISFLELTKYMQDRLLRDTDVCSMSSGVEVRVPLLDHLLVERIWKIPSAIRSYDIEPKQLLISAASDLPPSILGAKKKGFMMPMQNWMRTILKPTIREVLNDAPETYFHRKRVLEFYDAFERGSGIHWSRVLSLFVLCHWLKANKVTGST